MIDKLNDVEWNKNYKIATGKHTFWLAKMMQYNSLYD